jgi:hypothetical protein
MNSILKLSLFTFGVFALVACGSDKSSSPTSTHTNAKPESRCLPGMEGKYYFVDKSGVESFIEIEKEGEHYLIGVEGEKSKIATDGVERLDGNDNLTRGFCRGLYIILDNNNADIPDGEPEIIKISKTSQGISVIVMDKHGKRIASSTGVRK